MKSSIGLLVALLAFAVQAQAADIYVRATRGINLTRAQQTEVTDLVSSAVRSMPEHNLVANERDADFVLQPTIINRGHQQLLRVEKYKGSDIMAMSEEPINSIDASNDRAYAVTETALQNDDYVRDGNYNDPNFRRKNDRWLNRHDRGTVSGSTSAAEDASGNTVVGPSPAFPHRDFPGFFQIGVGPSFGAGMDSDNVMTDITASYNYRFTDMVIGKGFADFNMATGSDSARFIEPGIGAEFYPADNLTQTGKPYLGVDAGWAFARDNEDNTQDGLALGAGAGFKFAASALNMDVNLHYSVLTNQLHSTNPSVTGVRLALNF